MKKIFLVLFALGMLVSSCDMDKRPYGSLDDETAIQSLNDCYRFRNGLYSSLRSLTTGGYITYPDVQVDLFQGMIDNGNRLGIISVGNLNSATSEFETIWQGLYSVINSANYILGHMEVMLNSGAYSGTELTDLKRYIGEAKFVRGYCYYWLADHYCEAYTTAIGQTPGKGLPLVTVYNPTGDSSVYPGRSTQDETYQLIAADLTAAYDALVEYEKTDSKNVAPNASYLSSYAVLALQARIALLKGENETALEKAEEVIESGIYPLAALEDYAFMWSDDEATEVIFRSFMSKSEQGASTGSTYLRDKNYTGADYIPTFEVLSMYEEGDVRFEAFFTPTELNVQGSKVVAYVFSKYPGNTALDVDPASPDFLNMGKPFRTSELYLIAAEAAITEDASLANKYLNELRKARIENYVEVNYSGDILVQQIRAERKKELLGEGQRLSDLRRWNQGFQRDASYPVNPDVVNFMVLAGKDLAYLAGDHRFVWPIPSAEMQSNPQLAGQQNPGY